MYSFFLLLLSSLLLLFSSFHIFCRFSSWSWSTCFTSFIVSRSGALGAQWGLISETTACRMALRMAYRGEKQKRTRLFWKEPMRRLCGDHEVELTLKFPQLVHCLVSSDSASNLGLPVAVQLHWRAGVRVFVYVRGWCLHLAVFLAS